jgi:hypothetical protein
MYALLGFFFKLIPCTYFCKKLRAYGKKVDIVISNEDLSKFGFKSIKQKIASNDIIESIRFKGQQYEYMGMDERKCNKVIKLV